MRLAGWFWKTAVSSLAGLIFVVLLASSCAAVPDFDEQLGEITRSHAFSIVGWERAALPQEVGDWFVSEAGSEGIETVRQYFDNVAQIGALEAKLSVVVAGDRPGDPTALANALDNLREENEGLAPVVEKVLAGQIRETLVGYGIYNPLLPVRVSFPPVNFSLEPPPHLLVVSPRDRIDSMREVRLAQAMDLETMEAIEAAVDELSVSALVVELGGFGGTYPTFVADTGGLQYTIETAVEEWLHQYLAFTPLGFAYVLDATGISCNYEVDTMNETVAGIVSGEIGEEIYNQCYAEGGSEASRGDNEEFNRAMRQTRLRVDELLAQGEMEAAEGYMEERRQYVLSLGYYIRKLNQAYFAFHGMYADSPTSVDPIGEELKELRAQSRSVKEFLDTVAPMTSRADLQQVLAE